MENPGTAKAIRNVFTPKNFARWFYDRVKEWAKSQPKGQAYVHVFRKTALQLAWDGEDEMGQRVAQDSGVSESVLRSHYVKPKLWRQSNRTYFRIQASLPPEVASRYGHKETPLSALERKLEGPGPTRIGPWLRNWRTGWLRSARMRPDSKRTSKKKAGSAACLFSCDPRRSVQFL